jgi:putative peptidoglycan lipid II flippase
LAQPLVALAFQRGAFGVEQATLLAGVVAVYALQFPFDAVNRVFISYWYARLNTAQPFANVAIMVALDIAFAAILFVPLGIYGIALAYILSSVAYLVHGAVTVHRKITLPGRRLVATLGKIALASLLAGTASAITLASLPEAVDLVMRVLRLAIPGVVGLVVLLATLAALRIRIWSLLLPARAPRPEGER